MMNLHHGYAGPCIRACSISTRFDELIKLYENNKKIRLVYTIHEGQIQVQIIAIGRREGFEVYEDASKRI